MTDHERVLELLPLAAAGALDPAGQRLVLEHAAGCAECARVLEGWNRLASDLRSLPVPVAPAGLAARTGARLAREVAESAERRWSDSVLVFLSLFGWTVSLSAWAILRVLENGLPLLLDVHFRDFLVWSIGSSVLAWLTAGVAALVLGRRRRSLWRSYEPLS